MSPSPLTAEQIFERVAERGDDEFYTAIALAAFAVAVVEGCDAQTRATVAWHLRRYAASLDGATSDDVTH
jgi:hypothetical protein